jgi:hypothetical protein
MENLKQGVAPLIVLRKNCINIRSIWKGSRNCKRITSFLEKYPADEVITNIENWNYYNGENQENNLV